VFDYCNSIKSADVVGVWVAIVLRVIKENYPDLYLHGIGFSLGAHLLGSVSEGGPRFDRITGLDPAGPAVVFKGGVFSWVGMKGGLTELNKDKAGL
jgi:hypothetical protein